jgi:hypothetical protein
METETEHQLSPYEINRLVLQLKSQLDLASCAASEIKLLNAQVLNHVCGLMVDLMRNELEGRLGLQPDIDEDEFFGVFGDVKGALWKLGWDLTKRTDIEPWEGRQPKPDRIGEEEFF